MYINDIHRPTSYEMSNYFRSLNNFIIFFNFEICFLTFWKLTSLAFRNPELNTIVCVFADFSYLWFFFSFCSRVCWGRLDFRLWLKCMGTIGYLNTHLGLIIWILEIYSIQQKKETERKERNSTSTFSNFSCMFLNPNNFFQIEL